MLRVVVVAALGAWLGGLVGCGDLSEEDLLFRAAVPPKEAVAVTPPGSGDIDEGGNSLVQGLIVVCAEGDLRCEAQKIATGFNTLTFGLLDAIDAVAALTPTIRERGRRIWGPIYDAQKDQTFRFEMVRADDDVTFTFCLFMAQGQVELGERNRELNCDSLEPGFLNVFSGSFQPSSIEDGARRGQGTMRFEADRVSRFDGSSPFARTLDFAFDNQQERTDIHVDVVGASVGDEERDAAYDFEREADGSGTFLFDVFADLISQGLLPTRRLEHIRLSARWNVEQGGRALGVVDDGDIAIGSVLTVEQCWAAAPEFETSYFDVVDDVVQPVGDADACVFAVADVTPAS